MPAPALGVRQRIQRDSESNFKKMVSRWSLPLMIKVGAGMTDVDIHLKNVGRTMLRNIPTIHDELRDAFGVVPVKAGNGHFEGPIAHECEKGRVVKAERTVA